MAHTHLSYDRSTLAHAAQDVLTGAGEQWTEMRARVFDALASSDKPASAYEVADRVSAAVGRRVVPNTVYRILDLFVGKNLALRVESQNAYVANDHPGCVHDCIFMVCDRCGGTVHLDDDKIAQSIRKSATLDGFQVRRPVIEVLGTCRDCLAA